MRSLHLIALPVALLGLCVALPLAAQNPQAVAPGQAEEEADAATHPEVGRGSAPGQVNVALSPDETTVGGRVRAEITVVWMGEVPKEAVRFPTWQETWGDAEILSRSEVESFEDQSGRHVSRQVLELTAFEAGDVDLPARTFVVPLDGRTVPLESEPTRFVITSLLPPRAEEGAAAEGRAEDDARQADPNAPPAASVPDAEAELEPRGAAPPATLDASPVPFATSVVALALLFLGGLERLRRELAREAAGEAAAETEADAFARLEPLEELMARLDRIDPLHGSAAHTGLSLALRRYLGRSFHFNAVESTTTEIQRRLLQGASATPPVTTPPVTTPPVTKPPVTRPPVELAQRSLELLRAADLVKFAGLEADASIARGRVAETRELARGIEAFLERSRRPLGEGAEEGGENADGPVEEAA